MPTWSMAEPAALQSSPLAWQLEASPEALAATAAKTMRIILIAESVILGSDGKEG